MKKNLSKDLSFQKKVLESILLGHSQQEIAKEFNTSTTTVSLLRRAAFPRLGQRVSPDKFSDDKVEKMMAEIKEPFVIDYASKKTKRKKKAPTAIVVREYKRNPSKEIVRLSNDIVIFQSKIKESKQKLKKLVREFL